MTSALDRPYQWMFYLAVAFLFGATVLRSLINYQGNPELNGVLGLLAIWLALFKGEALISNRWPRYFPLYLLLQSALAFALLLTTDADDYFAVLFGILSMQIALRFSLGPGALWIGAFAVLMALPMIGAYGVWEGLAFVVIYSGGSGLLASYALTLRRAQEAQSHNHILMGQLQDSNRQLQAYARQSQELVVTRERHHLARELHDSVTQTIFTMTLATQSAWLLMEREPGRVGAQLDQLNRLAQSALSEMQALISELRPESVAEGGLAAAIRRHLTGRYLPERLSVSLEVEGGQSLDPSEAQGLFRIVQEALNNVVKHAQSPQVNIHLHLADPLWIEIVDHGQGFDLPNASNRGSLGLANMRERAAEIGWDMRITTSPGAGTRVRVEKRPSGGKLP